MSLHMSDVHIVVVELSSTEAADKLFVMNSDVFFITGHHTISDSTERTSA